MQSTLQRALEGMDLGVPEQEHFQQRMHFATDPVPNSNTWIPRLLDEWTTSRKVVAVSTHAVSTQPGAYLPTAVWQSSVSDLAVLMHAMVKKKAKRWLTLSNMSSGLLELVHNNKSPDLCLA